MAQLIDPNGDAGGNVVGIDNEDNTLIGLGGDDFLSGANLNDTLFGGAGNDFLSGGDGRDVFVMQHNPFGPETFGTDEVTDFSATDDRIDLTELRIGEYETLFAVMADTPRLLGSGATITWDDSILRLPQGVLGSSLGAGNFIFSSENLADVFVMGASNDWLAAGLGADFLDGTAGDDRLFGEQDADTVVGGAGNDSVYGGSGNDTVVGDAGNDLVHGGAGNDLLQGGEGNNTVVGSSGADTLKLSQGAMSNSGTGSTTFLDFDVTEGDRIDVSSLGRSDLALSSSGLGIGSFETIQFLESSHPSGRALTWGTVGLVLDGTFGFTAGMFLLNTSTVADSIFLNSTADIAAGGLGNDSVRGGGGADRLFGEQGDDSLDGETGDDLLHGGIGNDALNGGTGNDLLFGSTGRDNLSGGDGTDTLNGGDGGDVLIGGKGLDRLVGGTGDDVYLVGNERGQKAVDTIVEVTNREGGFDSVMVTANDYVLGDGIENAFALPNDMQANRLEVALNDLLTGLVGSDRLVAIFALPFLQATIRNVDAVNITGNELDNRIDGDNFSSLQTLSGLNGDDVINGMGNADLIFGGKDDDKMSGGNQNDTIFGGTGEDTLSGGRGFDNLFGGTGEDQFVFETRSRSAKDADAVLDFGATDFLAFDATVFTELSGASGRSIGRSQFVNGTAAQDGNDHVIYDQSAGRLYYDADGRGGADQVLVAEIYTRFETISLVQGGFRYSGNTPPALSHLDILIS